jgi:hypothetical protein
MIRKEYTKKDWKLIIISVMAIFLLAFCISVSTVWGATIAIVNPGFEADIIPDGTTTAISSGWTGAEVAFNPTTDHFVSEAPEGFNTAAINFGSISQNLSTTVILGQTYILQVEVGNRLDTAFPGYAVELLAGGNSVGIENVLNPTAGTFLTSTVSWTADNFDGLNLGIQLSSNEVQTNFDDVRLNAVPIPGAVWLLGSGLLGLIGFRRKFKK